MFRVSTLRVFLEYVWDFVFDMKVGHVWKCCSRCCGELCFWICLDFFFLGCELEVVDGWIERMVCMFVWGFELLPVPMMKMVP